MKKLACPIPDCKKSYRSRFTLRRHLEAFHYRTKRFACEHCEKSFAYRHTLRKHLRKTHRGVSRDTVMVIPLLTHLLRYCSDAELKPVFPDSPIETTSVHPVNTSV